MIHSWYKRAQDSHDQDQAYLEAVQHDDMEAAKKMIDEAAANNGYNVGPVYHGGTFDPSKGESWKGRGPELGWFSHDKSVSEHFARHGGQVTMVYLRMEKTEVITAQTKNSLPDEERISQGYDSRIFEDMYGETIVVFSPSQIKSADTVTHGDNGDIIPLSQRFDDSTDDIRY